MTPEEIKKGNLEIAKMIGVDIIEAYPPNKDYKQSGLLFKLPKEFAEAVGEHHLYHSSLKFHLSYNWLMEVVEFIEENEGTQIWIGKQECTLFIERNSRLASRMGFASKKAALFDVVSKYAERYNTLNP